MLTINPAKPISAIKVAEGPRTLRLRPRHIIQQIAFAAAIIVVASITAGWMQ